MVPRKKKKRSKNLINTQVGRKFNDFRSYFSELKRIHRIKLKLAATFLNAFLLIALTIFFQYISFIRIDETIFFKWFAIVKHNILHIDNKPAQDSVVFLDLSKDLEIVDDTSNNYGSVVIKNRKVLAGLFSVLNRHPNEYNYIVCDVFFDYPSPNDIFLKPEIEKTKNLITASAQINGKTVSQLFNVPNASVAYASIEGSFVRLPIFHDDTVKTLPVKMAEALSKDKYCKKGWFVFKNRILTFNTVIPDYYYRSYDLVRESSNENKSKKANLFYLGEILDSTDGFFNKYLKNKYIIIGDFETDTHPTYLGSLPGPLILFDTFLTLRNKPIIISWYWILFLFIIYLIISHFIFIHPERSFEQLRARLTVPFFKDFIKKYVSYVGILVTMNLVSCLFFGVFISLFYIATYLTFLTLLLDKRRRYLKSKNLITFVKEELA